ncbi:MAG TPA: response regulator transcription factor [Thermoanaerobaculia bacterium]|nr:response regulator transcription factor [Thermoanaerobaculia bacterium]
MPTRILIADDHGILRAGLRALLNEETDYEVVGEAATSDEALHAALDLKPGFVLMDLSMPGIGGIEVTRQLKERLPETKVLILTVHEDATLLREAMKAGAAGYVVKRAVESELIEAIETVRRGDLYVHPSMTRALLSEEQPAPPPSRRGDFETLTNREVEVLRLIVRGYTNRQVADDLFVSVRTVESHRANIMQKLELSSRADLVRWAAEHKLTA